LRVSIAQRVGADGLARPAAAACTEAAARRGGARGVRVGSGGVVAVEEEFVARILICHRLCKANMVLREAFRMVWLVANRSGADQATIQTVSLRDAFGVCTAVGFHRRVASVLEITASAPLVLE